MTEANRTENQCPHKWEYESFGGQLQGSVCIHCGARGSLSNLEPLSSNTEKTADEIAQEAYDRCVPPRAPLSSKNEVSAFTAGEWLSVGVTDRLVPLADYERLQREAKKAFNWRHEDADTITHLRSEIGRLRAALEQILKCDQSPDVDRIARKALRPEGHENE